jgi:hypothetical protein
VTRTITDRDICIALAIPVEHVDGLAGPHPTLQVGERLGRRSHRTASAEQQYQNECPGERRPAGQPVNMVTDDELQDRA